MSKLRPLLAALAASLAFLAGCGVTTPTRPVAAVVSATTFDFGPVIDGQPATRTVVTLTNTGSSSAAVGIALTGDPSFTLDPNLSCPATLVAGGECAMALTFTPANTSTVEGALSLGLSASGSAVSTQTVALSGTGVQLSAGGSLVTTTANPVVARYSWQPENAGSVAVEFGPTTSYGLTTGAVPTPANNGPVSLLVAGMRQSTTYHLRAMLTQADGTVTYDQDHTFTTTSFPASSLPQISVTTPANATPQPGIELANASLSTSNPAGYLPVYATDLAGNIIWGYNFPDRPTAQTIVQPIKPLPNGDFLVTLSFAQQYLLPDQGHTLTAADQSVDLVREIDLAGDPIRQVTLAQINAQLAAQGYNFQVSDIHHDFAILPDGHVVLITALLKSVTGLTGSSGPVTVLGDVLIDLDQNFNVSWVWNEFDHLDVNRQPMNFPDWTHTNAILYSPADGALVVSIRHQDWVIKIDYGNGQGTGDILWHLGYQGDFTLQNGTAPQDWFYAQHAPSFVTGATTGSFSMTLMDNGDNRINATGATCGSGSFACYTTVPILALSESARTAAITFRQTIPASQYSEYGGNAEVLANGDLEYDLCSDPFGTGSVVNEITTGASPQTVWSMTVTGANLYRAMRMPSLYPGVQW